MARHSKKTRERAREMYLWNTYKGLDVGADQERAERLFDEVRTHYESAQRESILDQERRASSNARARRQQDQRKPPASFGPWTNFLETHCGEGDHRHVYGFSQRPPFDCYMNQWPQRRTEQRDRRSHPRIGG